MFPAYCTRIFTRTLQCMEISTEIITLVFITLKTKDHYFHYFDSSPFFHTAIFVMRPSKISAKITRSYALSISHGHSTWNSHESASRTMVNSKGLNTDPWCTPTLTLNSSLKVVTLVLLLASTYMACTSLTNHSGTPTTLKAHFSSFRCTLLKAFSKLTNPIYSSLCFGRYFSWSSLRIKIASVVPGPGQKSNCISSVLTVSRMMFPTTLSIAFRT